MSTANTTTGWRLPFGAARRKANAAAATRPPLPDPDLRARRFLAFALALAQGANVLAMKPMLMVGGIAALLLALLLTEPPRRWYWRALLMFATLATAWLVYREYERLIGRDPGIAILFVLGPLKLIEAKSTRDFMVVWGLGLMLYVTSFFENLGLLAALSVPPVIIVYIAALRMFDAAARAEHAQSWWQHLKGAAVHTLLGVPLAAALFILFPRATAPLWGVQQASIGRTGLSDSMQPGDIASLIQSRETAFRVEFEGRRPPQQALYWRGPVLREFNGVKWSVGAETPTRMRGDFVSFTRDELAREAIVYTMTLERQDSRWLPTLDLPVAYPVGPAVERTTYLTDAQQVGLRRPPGGAIQFRAQSIARASYPAAEIPEPRSDERRTGPSQYNPRARAFAADLASRYPDPRERVRALLAYFNQEQFYYTLQPGEYNSSGGTRAIDEFMFDRRRGFCEHYASSTVFVLRASGIPARVVTGYQGGEYHPSGHLIVRQSDAHAWVEALLEGQWMRIDPTAAVAPNRIERGIEQALPDGERGLISGRGWLSFLALNNLWEDATFTYTKWIIGFDRDRQRELLSELGIDGMNPLTALGWMLIAITLSGVLMLGGWWLWRKQGERKLDPELRAWRRLRRRLTHAGLAAAPHETAATVLARAAQRWPQHAATFDEFARRYNAARFQRSSDADRSIGALVTRVPWAYRLRRIH